MNKIALLGASGHIGKNIVKYFAKNEQTELYLFSRDKNKLKIFNEMFPGNSFNFFQNTNFKNLNYDVIINCAGISNPHEISSLNQNLVSIIVKNDDMVIDYLKKNTNSLFINISSGAVFGEIFSNPSTQLSEIKPSNVFSQNYYAKAKIQCELKHRELTELNIVDLRLFNFFSRYIGLNTDFFMSHVVSSLKNKKKFLTNNIDFKRDFIHPLDFGDLIEKCVIKHNLNSGFDVYSKKPISKFEILDLLYEKYHLNFEIIDASISVSPTGLKKNYFSNSRKALEIGYKPNYTSLETIVTEIQFCL